MLRENAAEAGGNRPLLFGIESTLTLLK